MDFRFEKNGQASGGQRGSPNFVSPRSFDKLSSSLQDFSFGTDGLHHSQPPCRSLNGIGLLPQYGLQTDSRFDPPGQDSHGNIIKSENSEYLGKKMMAWNSGDNMMNSYTEKVPSRGYHSDKNLENSPMHRLEHQSNPYSSKMSNSKSLDYPLHNQVTELARCTYHDQREIPFRIINDVYSGINPHDVPYRLPGHISNKMVDQLDGEQKWKKLIKAVDNTHFAISIPQLMKLEQNENHNSPTRQLFRDFSGLGMTIEELAYFLDAAQLYCPLELIRQPEPLRIITQPKSAVIEENDCLTLTCEAVGFPYPRYSWYFSNKFQHAKSKDLFCNQSTLRISSARRSESGHYICQVWNSLNREVIQSDWVEVTVLQSSKPSKQSIQHQPSHLTIVEESPWSKLSIVPGRSVEITCRAEGEPTPSYKWHKNCIPMDGQYLPTLKIPDVKYSDSGSYFCVVDNGYTMMRSKHFNVKVVAAGEDVYAEMSPSESTATPIPRNVFYAQAKVALLIGMESYQGPQCNLPAAENDVKCLEGHLKRMGFMVVSLLNLTKDMMLQHITWFCALLDRGVYGLFFFIGHGFEYLGQSFLIPMEATEPYKTQDCLSLQKDVLFPILNRNPMLCMAIIDMCRVSPPKTQKSDIPEDVRLPANGKTIILFATSVGHQSYEDKQTKMSFFMQYLDKVIDEPTSVCELHEKVASQLKKDKHVGKLQYTQMETTLINRYSLHDPVNYCGYTVIMNKRRMIWESATRLPRNQQIPLPPYGFLASISFGEHVSNEIRMVFIVREMGNVSEYTVSLASLPQEIITRPDSFTACHKPNIEMIVSFKGLEKLREPLMPELQLDLLVSGEMKRVTRTLDLGWPLISNLQLGMRAEKAASFEGEKEKEPTQQEESCHSGAHQKLV